MNAIIWHLDQAHANLCPAYRIDEAGVSRQRSPRRNTPRRAPVRKHSRLARSPERHNGGAPSPWRSASKYLLQRIANTNKSTRGRVLKANELHDALRNAVWPETYCEVKNAYLQIMSTCVAVTAIQV